MLGVRVGTVARWAVRGRLTAWTTPGGHRRYRRADVARLVDELAAPTPHPHAELVSDAVHLYADGLSTRAVAEKIGLSYGATRRLLRRHTTLRPHPGATDHPPPDHPGYLPPR